MGAMAGNSNLHDSAKNKQDEFYTRLQLIEDELKHYRAHFKGKRVLCNCHDPYESNFFKFFAMNFNALGLKSLTATCYATSPVVCTQLDLFGNDKVVVNRKKKGAGRKHQPYKIVITEGKDENGDGRVDLADVEWLIRNKKNVLVPDSYEEKATDFKIEDGQKWRRMGNICWFTNLDIQKRHEKMLFWKKYSPEEYPKYDNYDAIEVAKTAEIPCDWDGEIGVPITFMGQYNPDQFEIIRFRKGDDGRDFMIGGKSLYFRIIIRRRRDA